MLNLKKDFFKMVAFSIAKPAERQKKLIILGDGLAKHSEPQQCKFQLESLLVPLTSNRPTVQAILNY